MERLVGRRGGGRHDELIIITAGKLNMRVWDLDLANRKAPPRPPRACCAALRADPRMLAACRESEI